MNAHLLLRDATPGDGEAISALLEELGHPLHARAVHENLARMAAFGPSYFVLIASLGGRPAGVISGFATPVLHREHPVGRLSVLVVARSHAGSGIGSALVTAAERRFASLGCRRIEVTSAAHRTEAHEFYRRRGYHQQGLRFLRELSAESGTESTA